MPVLSLWIAVFAGGASSTLDHLPICEPAFDDEHALAMPTVIGCAIGRPLERASAWLGRPPCSLAGQLEASAADAEPIGPIR